MKVNKIVEDVFREKLNKLKNKKLVGSQLIVGYYFDLLRYWQKDNGSLKPNEIYIINTIISTSLCFRYKHCYLKYSDFILSHPTISKTIKSLKEKGLLKVTNTRKSDGSLNKNKYELLFPEFMYEYLVFQKKKDEVNDTVEKQIMIAKRLREIVKENGGVIEIRDKENEEINKLLGKKVKNVRFKLEDGEVVEEKIPELF